jgi:hypothetical protein
VSGLYTCLPPRYFGGTADSGASGWTGGHAEDDGERSAIAAQDGKRSKNAARACVAAWKEHRVEHSDWGRGFAGRGPTPEVGTVGLPELTGVVAVEERREERAVLTTKRVMCICGAHLAYRLRIRKASRVGRAHQVEARLSVTARTCVYS